MKSHVTYWQFSCTIQLARENCRCNIGPTLLYDMYSVYANYNRKAYCSILHCSQKTIKHMGVAT